MDFNDLSRITVTNGVAASHTGYPSGTMCFEGQPVADFLGTNHGTDFTVLDGIDEDAFYEAFRDADDLLDTGLQMAVRDNVSVEKAIENTKAKFAQWDAKYGRK